MDAGIRGVPHRIHEDCGKELHENQSHLRTDQFIGQHLSEELGGFLSDLRVGGVTEQIEEVDECAFRQRLFDDLRVRHQGKQTVQRGESA